MTSPIERFGARVATVQDATLAASQVPSTDDVLAGVQRRRRAQRRTRALVTATATLLVMVGVLIGTQRWMRTEAIELARTEGQTQPALGAAAAETTDVPLVFRDGTTIVVQRGAKVELKEVREHGAFVTLDEGALNVDVVHTSDSRWDVKAGPFGIRVTGTRFNVSFDARTKALTIAMTEGTVMVSGPCVNEPLSAPARKVFICPDDPPQANGRTIESAPAPPGQPSPSSVPPARFDPAARSAHREAPRWKADVDRGDFQKAAREMTSSDLEAAIAREPAASLVALADAARTSGDTVRATLLYTKIRERFPRSEPAAKSAFLLGRMADASGVHDEAARWFELVMGESPNGFAQEAHGRLMELEQKCGHRDRVVALAIEYLRKYPNGPHGAYAASVVDVRR